jgi:hypothetical protein
MQEIFGHFPEEILSNHKIFMMDFYLNPIPPVKRKQTRYLSVAFITDYLSNLFPVNEEEIDSYKRNLQIKSIITYLVNELLENLFKFHNYNVGNYPVKIELFLLENDLVLAATNSVSYQALEKLKLFIEELLNSDIDELYFRQLEKGAEENSEKSQLGFISMINDYNAKLGWKIERVNDEPEIITVKTMVQIKI